jgi:hypothetical protein
VGKKSGYKPTPLETRFWQRVFRGSDSDCWPWLGCQHNFGYGVLGLGGKSKPGRKNQDVAHRISWMIHYGSIPVGLFVLHKCDNPLCVNPAHLFLGTQTDNMQDMTKKGRRMHGQRHYHAKLKDSDVLDIRVRYRNGERITELAKQFGVTWETMAAVAKGRTWKHLEPANGG